ncbi:MAG: SDR family NAD(P)-dependent oxidoreductase [Fidelibacterota bacterium]
MKQPRTLNEFTCVVTGAGGATGGAIARYLVAQGATVVGTRRGPEVELVKEQDRFYTVVVNLSDRSATELAVAEILSSLGQVHAWINVAGGFRMGAPVEEVRHSQIHEMMQMNFFTALNGCGAIVRHLKTHRFGRLINFGSAAVKTGMAQALPYLISKAAVHELTLSLAQELEPDVTCNLMIPGIIDTPANRQAMPDADRSTWTPPEAIARTVGDLLLSTKNGEEVYV